MSCGAISLFRCGECHQLIVAAQITMTLLPDGAGYRLKLQPIAPRQIPAHLTAAGLQLNRDVICPVGATEAWWSSLDWTKHACPEHLPDAAREAAAS